MRKNFLVVGVLVVYQHLWSLKEVQSTVSNSVCHRSCSSVKLKKIVAIATTAVHLSCSMPLNFTLVQMSIRLLFDFFLGEMAWFLAAADLRRLGLGGKLAPSVLIFLFLGPDGPPPPGRTPPARTLPAGALPAVARVSAKVFSAPFSMALLNLLCLK